MLSVIPLVELLEVGVGTRLEEDDEESGGGHLARLGTGGGGGRQRLGEVTAFRSLAYKSTKTMIGKQLSGL